MSCLKLSKREARPCAITASPMEPLDIFSIVLPFMVEREPLARAQNAEAPSNALHKPDAQLFTARNVKSNSQSAELLTLGMRSSQRRGSSGPYGNQKHFAPLQEGRSVQIKSTGIGARATHTAAHLERTYPRNTQPFCSFSEIFLMASMICTSARRNSSRSFLGSALRMRLSAEIAAGNAEASASLPFADRRTA